MKVKLFTTMITQVRVIIYNNNESDTPCNNRDAINHNFLNNNTIKKNNATPDATNHTTNHAKTTTQPTKTMSTMNLPKTQPRTIRPSIWQSTVEV